MSELKSKDIEKEVKPKQAKNSRKTQEISKNTPLKIKKIACLKKMRELIESYGPWSINKSELERTYFVDWNTINSWFNGILKSLDAESIDNISRKGEKMIENHMKRLEGIAEDSSDKERISAITASFKGLETLGNWLERFGRKQKVAEKLDISGNMAIGSAEHMRKIWEETNAESKSDSNKSYTG